MFHPPPAVSVLAAFGFIAPGGKKTKKQNNSRRTSCKQERGGKQACPEQLSRFRGREARSVANGWARVAWGGRGERQSSSLAPGLMRLIRLTGSLRLPSGAGQATPRCQAVMSAWRWSRHAETAEAARPANQSRMTCMIISNDSSNSSVDGPGSVGCDVWFPSSLALYDEFEKACVPQVHEIYPEGRREASWGWDRAHIDDKECAWLLARECWEVTNFPNFHFFAPYSVSFTFTLLLIQC